MESKAYARILSHSRPTGLFEGWLRFGVEYVLTDGAHRSGKLDVEVEINGEGRTEKDIREKIAEHLTTKYAPDTFLPRQIIGITL